MPHPDPRTRTIAQFAPDLTTASGLDIERTDDALVIRFPWRSSESVAIAVLAVGGLVAAGAVLAVAPIAAGLPVGVATALASLTLAWVAAAGLLNRTEIRADAAGLAVTHGPVPWPAPDPLPPDQISQIFVDLHHVGPRWGPAARVRAMPKDGPPLVLTPYLIGRRSPWAVRIEAEIERHLDIEDCPVHCANCGYDLRSTPRRCPECGQRAPRRRRSKR